MAENYIDKWNANGQEYDIQDAGRGLPLGVATLDNEGRIPYEQLPESAVEFKGYWNANTNTPHLADGSGTKGDMYYVDVAGAQDLGSGTQYFNVGDRVLYDGSTWKNINGTAVKSVNSRFPTPQGNVDLSTSVIRASTTTVTGVTIQDGDVVRIMFTQDLLGSDTITGLSISYNGTPLAVKVAKDGALADFVATDLGGTPNVYKYLQAYTTLEMSYDETSGYLIIIGNPIVLSSASYIFRANGFNDYAIYDLVGTSYKGKTYTTSYSNPVLTLPKGSYLVLISGIGYSSNCWELDLIISSGSALTVVRQLDSGSVAPTKTVINNTISAKSGTNDLYIYATCIGNNWITW